MTGIYAELRRFANGDIESGFTHFCWGVYPYDGALPVFAPTYGLAIDVTRLARQPESGDRYNPDKDAWASPLPEMSEDIVRRAKASGIS